MALMLLCQLVLLATVSCQTQNSTGQLEATNTESQYSLNQSSSNQTTNETTQFPTQETVTSVDADTGGSTDESLADYFEKKIEQLIGAGSSNTEEVVSTLNDTDLQNCSLPAVLDQYCEGIPQDVYVYFHYDMSISSILARIFQPDIVATLQSNCTAGDWCLPDTFHEGVKLKKTEYYLDSPFCSDAMWTCMTKMRQMRIGCGEKQLNYLVDVVFTLCDMEGLGLLTEDCYARTMEVMYVTYADLTHPNGSILFQEKANPEQTDCDENTVQVTKTYLCADDVCTYDQQLLLEKFEPLVPITKVAADVATVCNISRSACQSLDDYGNGDPSSSYGYYSDDAGYGDYTYEYGDENKLSEEETEKLEEELEKELEEIMGEEESSMPEGLDEISSEEEDEEPGINQFGNENEVNADSEDGYDKQDRSMMLGLIVMTTALLLGFVGLAFMVYRRFKRIRNGSYKWGYSQLANEEARVVHNDYK